MECRTSDNRVERGSGGARTPGLTTSLRLAPGGEAMESGLGTDAPCYNGTICLSALATNRQHRKNTRENHAMLSGSSPQEESAYRRNSSPSLTARPSQPSHNSPGLSEASCNRIPPALAFPRWTCRPSTPDYAPVRECPGPGREQIARMGQRSRVARPPRDRGHRLCLSFRRLDSARHGARTAPHRQCRPQPSWGTG